MSAALAAHHYLRLAIRGEPDDLIVPVRKQIPERLETLLSADDSVPVGFFWFDTLDGRSIALNLAWVQYVRILWDVAPGIPDLVRSDDEMKIKLAGKPPVVEQYTETPENIYWLFVDLEQGEKDWVPFTDCDGETMILRAAEVQWIDAALHVLAEGQRAAGIDGDGSSPD